MKNIQDEIKHYDGRVGKSNQSYCPASRTKRQKTEQKATGGIDIEPQSKKSEILERKRNGIQKISQGKVLENFPHIKDTEPPD